VPSYWTCVMPRPSYCRWCALVLSATINTSALVLCIALQIIAAVDDDASNILCKETLANSRS
jgi:hypothetical protein